MCCWCTCDMAAGTTWDTVLIWEQKWSVMFLLPVFTAGMPAKLTWVKLRRHASGKALRWLELPAVHVLIRPRSSPGGTDSYNAGALEVLWEPGLGVIKFGCTCGNDCLPTTEVYLSLMTRASYVRSPWMTCQWEGQLMRFCVWFKLFNLQINMEKVGSCQHYFLCFCTYYIQ